MGSLGRTKRVLAAGAGVVLLGIGFFGGVAWAARGSMAGMMSAAGMQGMMSGAGMQGMLSGKGTTGGGDLPRMMAAMDGIMARMHPDMPAPERARLIEKCRETMAAMSGPRQAR